MIDIPLPKLFGTDGRTFLRTIRPIKASVELSIVPLSTASIELPENETLPARSYVEMFTSTGSAGIYRVRSPQNSYGEDTSISELEHAVVEIGDWLVLSEYSEMKQAGQAMQTLFSHYRGNKWQLGSVTALGTQQIALEARYESVLSAMITLMDQVPDCMMTFDFTTSPKWTLGFAKKDTTVSAEGRLSRNIESARITYDDSELCTRAYYEYESTSGGVVSGVPTFNASINYNKGDLVIYSNKTYVLTDGHVAGKTWAETTKVEKTDIPSTTWSYLDADTIGTWGIVEREVPTGGSFTETEALRAASEFIRKHKNPKVSIEISAEDLSYITGETLDTFRIGKLFRLAMPDYNLTKEENITAMSWEDVYSRPEEVSVSLADEEDTAVTYIHNTSAIGSGMTAGGGGGGGGGARKKQDDTFKEYRTNFQRTDYLIDMNAQHLNRAGDILQQAGMYIDSNGVLVYAQDNEKNVGSKLKVEADRISLVVEGTGEDAVVKRAAIQAAVVNSDGKLVSTIKITADNIDIDGDTFADYLQGTTINCDELNCDDLSSSTGSFSSLIVESDTLTVDGVGGFGPHSFSVSGTNKGTILSTGDINFNVADTVEYQQAVAAAYNQGWNECIDTAHNNGDSVLVNYSTYSSSSTALYVAPTGGAQMATGSKQIWRYGGAVVTRYTLPSKKT